MACKTLDTSRTDPYCLIRLVHPPRNNSMAETIPPLSVSEEKGVRIIEFTNSKILDEANIAAIQETLSALIDESENPRLLLDFATVDHLSSAALGALININSKIRQKNGQLRLANIKPQIEEVFKITKLDKLFRIKPTRTEAMASFTSH
jgi:anti-sigma B factor antagonist